MIKACRSFLESYEEDMERLLVEGRHDNRNLCVQHFSKLVLYFPHSFSHPYPSLSLYLSLTLSLSHSISLSLKAAKFEEPEYTVCHVRTDFCEGIEYERQDYSDRLTLRRAFIKSIEKLKSSHKVYLNRQIEEL